MENDYLNKNEENEKIPNQKELEKELSEYLSKKYGNRIKIISPFLFPKGMEDQKEDDDGKKDKKGDTFTFDLLPEELESHLDGFIVKQDKCRINAIMDVSHLKFIIIHP